MENKKSDQNPAAHFPRQHCHMPLWQWQTSSSPKLQYQYFPPLLVLQLSFQNKLLLTHCFFSPLLSFATYEDRKRLPRFPSSSWPPFPFVSSLVSTLSLTLKFVTLPAWLEGKSIMTASCQFRQTLHIKRGLKKKCSNENSSPWCHQGYWLPVDGVHWLELELTPESLESLNTVGFFWGRIRPQGIVGRTQRSYSLRGWRSCSASKLYFSPVHQPPLDHWITFLQRSWCNMKCVLLMLYKVYCCSEGLQTFLTEKLKVIDEYGYM